MDDRDKENWRARIDAALAALKREAPTDVHTDAEATEASPMRMRSTRATGRLRRRGRSGAPM